MRLLLAPDEGERAEEVDSTVARNVLGAVRARHALTVVDLGATVSEASAIGAEMATKVLIVSTPDVVALRGVRRLRDLWRRLQVREDDQDTLVLLNRPRASARSSPTWRARSSAAGWPRRRSRPTSPRSRPPSTPARPRAWRTRSCAASFEALATELEALPAADEPAGADGEPRGLLAAAVRRARPDLRRVRRHPAAAARSSCCCCGRSGSSATRSCSPATPRARARASWRPTRRTAKTDRPYADVAMEDLPKAWRKGAKVDRPEDEHRARAAEGARPVAVAEARTSRSPPRPAP